MNTIAKHGIQSDDIYSVDETSIMMSMIQNRMVVTGTNRHGKPKSVQPGNREWITVIQAINAEGWPIAPFIIGAGQYHLANWYRESNLPGGWAVATTRNGCFVALVSKTELFPAFYAAFQDTMTEKTPSQPSEGAGLVPLDLGKVVSKLGVQLRTPTMPEEEAELLTPWVSKTLKTVPEAQIIAV